MEAARKRSPTIAGIKNAKKLATRGSIRAQVIAIDAEKKILGTMGCRS
jgi:hypothetical protein